MIYKARAGAVSSGEAIGILLIENYVPFIPGDTANAATYAYPVRFAEVAGVTPQRLFSHDFSLLENLSLAVEGLVRAGVRGVTGDCGFLALFQDELAARFDVPIFLSSLLQIPFIAGITGRRRRIGIITANAEALDDEIYERLGFSSELRRRLVTVGLEDDDHFRDAVFLETGELDSDRIERAVVERAKRAADQGDVGAILLECSLLPPYGHAVHEAVGLPVFDYITMIDYLFSAVVKKRYRGFM